MPLVLKLSWEWGRTKIHFTCSLKFSFPSSLDLVKDTVDGNDLSLTRKKLLNTGDQRDGGEFPHRLLTVQADTLPLQDGLREEEPVCMSERFQRTLCSYPSDLWLLHGLSESVCRGELLHQTKQLLGVWCLMLLRSPVSGWFVFEWKRTLHSHHFHYQRGSVHSQKEIDA